MAVPIVEVVLTAVFLFVILGVTDSRAPKGFAPLAIGLSLTLIHLVSIPVTNTSVNPARSTGPARSPAGKPSGSCGSSSWRRSSAGSSPGPRTPGCSATVSRRPRSRWRRGGDQALAGWGRAAMDDPVVGNHPESQPAWSRRAVWGG